MPANGNVGASAVVLAGRLRHTNTEPLMTEVLQTDLVSTDEHLRAAMLVLKSN